MIQHVRNNCIFNCTTALYCDEGTTNITNLTTSFSISKGSNTSGNWGNINDDPLFVAQASSNWHLQATSPLNVRGDVIDLSAQFTTDKNGITRTITTSTGMINSSAAGWSMGVYEQD